MFATLLTATLVSVFSIQGALADFAIDTISLTQCGPAHVTWNASTPPYNLAVVPVDDPCNTILVDLGDHNGTSMTWHNVTVPSGTQVIFSLLDSADEEAWSGTMTVASGAANCLPAASSSALSAASSAVSSSGASGVAGSGSTNFAETPSGTASSAGTGATAVGAANAGTLPVSGALSNARLPASVTVLGSLAAIAAALAL
ncbi:hypothetical protein DFH11DRAFT_860702 [Phellopilus nigrolimitatus]|nr:hypothetical protein DFH11DRAFT_860702 [Phellopilus nigrolimitatus]